MQISSLLILRHLLLFIQGCDSNNIFKNKPQSYFFPLQHCLKNCGFYGDRLQLWHLSQARTCRSGRESWVQSLPTPKRKESVKWWRQPRGRRRGVRSAPKRCRSTSVYLCCVLTWCDSWLVVYTPVRSDGTHCVCFCMNAGPQTFGRSRDVWYVR